MKIFIRRIIILLFFTQICFAQLLTETASDNLELPKEQHWQLKTKLNAHENNLLKSTLQTSFYKRKSEWKQIIKDFWGPGESLTAKLETFDLYQNFARAHNATFQWNKLDWDSVASSLRYQINDSTSRGEFSRILNDLAFALKDAHVKAWDDIVMNTPLNPGTPILSDGTGYITNFGVGLTPLENKSLLIYKVEPNHPLKLVPGDIILGYEGIPWYQIITELLEGGLPHNLFIGGAESADNRLLLSAAGENWHLFDTIDVIKYVTGDTLHLSLFPMLFFNVTGEPINNEQMPVPGVQMPTLNWNEGAVTHGIIDETNIGYIYVYHHDYSAVSREFDEAVLSLMNTDGLIIDIRNNWGGYYNVNDGLSRLISYGIETVDLMERCSENDLFSICEETQPFGNWEIPNDSGTYYDRPIAVLLGPNCASHGDILSWQLTYVPNAKMFGRSPKAIYSGWPGPQPIRSGYSLRCPTVTLVDHNNPEIILWGQEYPDLEEAWLTPEGVAAGQDDVVERAKEWINSIVNVKVSANSHLPEQFKLSQNYPNPFNPSTTIKYSIPSNVETFIRLNVFDILGGEVAMLVNEKQKSDYYEVEWEASYQPSGVYFYQLTAGDFIETKKMILLR